MMTASIASNSLTTSSSAATSKSEEPPRHHHHSDAHSSSSAKKNKGTGRVRAAPVPNSVLDRNVLLKTLEQHDIHLPPFHVEAFYRQHYPDLPEFVQNYYQYNAQAVAAGAANKENDATNRKTKKKKNDNDDDDDDDDSPETADPSSIVTQPVTATKDNNKSLSSPREHVSSLPLKNAISRHKNRNRGQLPKVFLDFLAQGAAVTGLTTVTSRVAYRSTSRDGSTTKLVIALHDGKLVESVLMRYRNSRVSLCISSQCGCAMGCTFCATGTMGLSGNLTCGEILEQIVHADRWLAQEWQQKQQQQQEQQQQQQEERDPQEKQRHPQSKEDEPHGKKGPVSPPTLKVHSFVRNVVFMGMGEPLDNYNNVLEACRALIDRKRWNLAHGRVTVSTVGIVPRIRQLTRDLPQVSLAVSLHAPTQAMRQAIVPMAKLYPIEELIDALDQHMMVYATKQQRQPGEEVSGVSATDESTNAALSQTGESHRLQFTREERIKESTRRRAMIEYVMLNGPTSSVEAAHALGKLCQDRQLVINLIPYNATDVQDKLSCPTFQDMQVFQKIVQSYGSFCTIRRTMGADIDSACGQLITKKEREAAAAAAAAAKVEPDLEDVVRDPTRPSPQPPQSGSVRRIGGKQNDESTRSATITNKDNNDENDNDDDDDSGSDKRSLESWIAPLTIATSIAATCFLVSTVVLFTRRGGSRPTSM